MNNSNTTGAGDLASNPRKAELAWRIAKHLFGVLLVVVFFGLWYLNSSTPSSQIATRPFGAFQTVQFSSGGLLATDHSLVATDSGSILVFGMFSALAGQRLEIRTTKDLRQKLCVVGAPMSTCNVVAKPVL